MAKTLQFRRGTSAELDVITGSEGELFVDLTNDTIRVHDGSTQGGAKLAKTTDAESGDATTYANATSYADDVANTAYVNATAYADGIGNTAYSNAVAYVDAQNTDTIEEGGTNLYYLDSRVDSHLSGANGISYSSGVIAATQDISSGANVTFTKVTGLDTPTGGTDAATKAYVDEIAEGLQTKPAVEVITLSDLSATYDNANNGVGATLTADSNGAWPEIDGYTVNSTAIGENGILVAGQANTAHNGRYNLTTIGDGSNPWVLTRCGICDEPDEIAGAFIFVKHGTTYAGTGWVQVVADQATFVVGTDDIDVIQFSQAGVYTANDGLILEGLDFRVDANIAGDYLTYNSGVLNVSNTDLGTTANTTVRTITSTTGNDVDIPSANSTEAGVMSSADKDKLDGIAAGAQTGTVTSVSGTGSYNGLTLSGTVTGSGNITFGGTPTGTWPIDVSGNANTATTANTANALNTSNDYQMDSLGVGTAASGTTGEIRATNNVTAFYSDDRLKTHLGKIENALEKLCSLNGFYFEANETAQKLGYEPVREVGVSAQEVQKILPEIVVPAPIDEQYLTVRYEKMIPLLVEAIKEQQIQINQQQQQINELLKTH